jgi:hypothetical protein
MDMRKGLVAGYKKLGPTGRFLFWCAIIAIVLAVVFFIIQQKTGATKEGQVAEQQDRDMKHEKEMMALSSIDSKLENKIGQTSIIDFVPIGWRQIKTISADCGIKAFFVVNNGEMLISKLRLLDEYYIRIENLPNIQRWLSEISTSFNREKEDALVLYHKTMLETCKKIIQIFEDKYNTDMDSSKLQAILDIVGIKSQVYGQEKEYYFEPRVMRPHEKYPYEFGRSTGQEWLESAVLDTGTNMLVIVSILEYADKDGSIFRVFLVSRSDVGRDKFIKTSQNIIYYPLIEFKEWTATIK